MSAKRVWFIEPT